MAEEGAEMTDEQSMKDFEDSGWTLSPYPLSDVTVEPPYTYETILEEALAEYRHIWKKLSKK
jgi:hypothetical protein